MAPRKIRRFPKRVRTPDIFESKVPRAAVESAPLPLNTITVNLYLSSVANGHFRPRRLLLRPEFGKYSVGESPVFRGMEVRLL